MYVCLCNGITDHEIRAEILAGASTMRELCSRLGVATSCGRCWDCTRTILAETLPVEEREGTSIESKLNLGPPGLTAA
jgi:bacterioferritin-associated ferredoxin